MFKSPITMLYCPAAKQLYILAADKMMRQPQPLK
jgi:hypothetical protein